MKSERDDEIADRTAEERSENEGMPEHPAKARDPVRWAADRGKRVSQHVSGRPPSHTGLFGVALVSCAVLAALTSARGALHWMRHKGGMARLSR
jgi:hypothetical protein